MIRMALEQPWRIRVADALEVLTELPAKSVDAVVTDPPYGIGFRGEQWDKPTAARCQQSGEAFERWTAAWAAECLRVLKPGGFLVAFGSPRTIHRLTAGVEDAGFEIRDQLAWLFGSGIPKSRLVDGRSTTLKPGYEPILLARKPLRGNVSANERQYGTGRLGIEEARLPSEGAARGRWPCNVTLSHAHACRSGRCAASCAAGLLDRSRPAVRPSRFYYCAKPSRAERDAGCETLPARDAPIYHTAGTSRPRRNTHPTVKPVELMRWLIRLTVPPDGIVLDPFTGSGTTGVAALHEQRRFAGIEQDAAYARIARARLRDAARRAAKVERDAA